MVTMIVLVVIGAVLIALAARYAGPDIKRYVRISRM